MKKTCIIISNWTWGIVQTLIGFIVCLALIWRPKFFHHGMLVTVLGGSSGFSLGAFNFVDRRRRLTHHEYGHSIQSAMLGIFYLLIIVPLSMGWYWYSRIKYGRWSADFWTERWADELADKVDG